jgi:hypothetical protein
MIYPIVISIVQQLVILNPEFSLDEQQATPHDKRADGQSYLIFFI